VDPAATGGAAAIELEAVCIVYQPPANAEPFVAVEHVDLVIERGEFISIVGPSGCGKSTMLYAVGGLLPVARGALRVLGRPVTGPGPDRAMVFQNFALFPWLDVLANVTFGLTLSGVKRPQADERARRYVELVGLSRFAHHYPHQLSGGMQQRVGLARAMAVEPDVMLMDEPFGSLDAQTREYMCDELLAIWDRHKRTVVFVTHDIDEAIFLSDRVAILSARPATVRAVIEVKLPRPRPPELRNSVEHMHYRQQIWDKLSREVRVAAGREREAGAA
jgi:NitT/TauT family transport system ATP-binding protein